jgi:hypothetical protein
MIRNIKIHNIHNIIEISKFMEPNKCTHKKNLWKNLFKCFLWFFKVWWVQKIKVWRFLVVPPKEILTLPIINLISIQLMKWT